jgi:hypothetical protein
LVSAIVIPNGFIQDMTEPTLVKQFVSLGLRWDVDGTGVGPQHMMLYAGEHVHPVGTTAPTVTTSLPMPWDNSDGDFFFHRAIPFMRRVTASEDPDAGSFYREVGFEVSSARKLHENSEVRLSFQYFSLNGSNLPSMNIAWFIRSLLRQP